MPRQTRGPYLHFLRDRGCYYVRWREGGRTRQRSTGTSDLREAEAQLSDFLATRRRAVAGPRDPAQFPMIDALEDYAREHAPETAAPARIAYAVEALAPYWAENSVADVNRHSCRAYGRYRGVSDGTLRRELGTLRAAINYAHKMGRLTRPVHVWLPARPPGKSRWLTRPEAAALLRAAKKSQRARLHLPLFILIALHTGSRKGAILDLRWPQVDFEHGLIDFNPPGRKRTTKQRPIVPVGPRLLWFLKAARRRGTDLGYVINDRGQPIADIKKGFNAAVARADLTEVTPHTLRHTAGTWMALGGVDLFKVGRYLGHSHERTTELYAHHHPKYLRDAMEVLDR